MRPLGFHPGQQIAQRGGDLAPACPVECGHVEPAPALGAVTATPVQPCDGDQVAQALCLSGVCGFPGACGTVCFWAGDDAKGGC